MSITRTEALTLLGAGTQPGPLAFARLINELFDRIEALEATDTAILAGIGGVFSPHRLYQSDAILLWYDPSDLTTMFQDTAGTTPVTADGQSVALHLDKGQWGGKTLAQVLAAQTELVTNGAFDTDAAGWTAYNSATLSVVSGKLRTTNGASLSGGAGQAFATVVGCTYALTVELTGTNGFLHIGTSIGNTSILGRTLTANEAIQVKFVATATTTWVTVSNNNTTLGVAKDWDNISAKLIPGYHRVQATGTSMPKYETDGTLHWLLYDGTDDSTQTPTITWDTDEVAICAGVTKSSDAAAGALAELSVGNSQSFSLFAPGAAAANYMSRVRGTAISDNDRTTYTAPNTSVLSFMGKSTTDKNTLRINADEASVATDTGAGSVFNAAPIYFGRRGGTTLPFNGREYQTVIRSRLLSAAELSYLETFVAAKTGVIL